MGRRPLETKRDATMQDLEALPPWVKGEIIDGVLYTQVRPRPRHQDSGGGLYTQLRGPFQRGRGGPGGWWILVEPGIELPDAKEFSPDLAGWRRERLPVLPVDAAITIAPDWICEILSPRTRSYDLMVKRAFYARIGVGHLWYIDGGDRTLTVSRLHEGHWLEIGVWGNDDRVRAEPFATVEIDLAELWADPPEE